MVAQMLDFTGEHGLRDIADRLLERRRVEYIHEGALTFVATPGIPHTVIVSALVDSFAVAKHDGLTSVKWFVASENIQWEFRDGSRRFSIPDLTIAYPGFTDRWSLQDNTTLLAGITSPGCDTVRDDLELKPRRYAKGGVPLYLLVDQEKGEWTLHKLIEGRPRYGVHSSGVYGDPIALPEPFGFSISTDAWPPFEPEPRER